MKICIITPDYPDVQRSTFPFVKQLVDEFVRQGNECCVIAPFSITANRRICRFKETSNSEGGALTILRPNYFSVSNMRIGKLKLSAVCHSIAVKYALRHLPFTPDVIYAHFWESAIEGYDYAKRTATPLYVATGESTIPNIEFRALEGLRDYISGVICVSTKNKNESVSLGLALESKCVVIPNAVDKSKFHPMDKSTVRTKLGIPTDKFVISFVGWFDNRKGVKRVSDALKILNKPNIYALFIGKGPILPDYPRAIIKGSVPHNHIPLYINASDVFVLPTLREGCCNAIIEAMSCGVPIISSDLDFNYDVLNKSNSILVDPDNVHAIADAINLLYTDDMTRRNLSEQSFLSSDELGIESRAKKIISLMKSSL